MASFHIDPDIANAKTLATEFYTSTAHYESSKEKIFAHSWQFVGDTSMVNEPGSAHPFILLEGFINEPLVLTSDKKGDLHCLSNVCTHRGNLIVTAPCNTPQLRCRYHGRCFSHNGSFSSMPEFKEVKNFPAPDDDLHSLPLFRWGNLLFTSITATIPAGDMFMEILDRIPWFPMNKLIHHPELSKDYCVKAHWALYCENYLEGFHIPFVHAGLNQVLDFGEYTTETFRYCNLQLGIGKDSTTCFELPPDSPDYGKNVEAYYFWLFPNMMFNFYPWGLSINIVQPKGISECKVSFLTYVSDASKLETGAGSSLDTVELEDEEIVEKVQLGVRSRFYTHGRYSATREQGPHHFHSLIARFMNV